MINIDGSYGEGGGQILRTCLSLATITGQSIRIDRIRAGRKKPGLAAQHITSVRAAASVCQARVEGDRLGSMTLEFIPTCSPQAGKYVFDVTEAREGGSAGAVTLILQTILLPLALADGSSVVTLRGGTHVAWSPPVTYVEQVYLPMLSQMGVRSRIQLRAWGWYPQGGGEVELQVTGIETLQGIQLLDRGRLRQVKGLAVVTELPSHIPQRMASRAENLLQELKERDSACKIKIQPLRERGIAPGAGIFLTAEYEGSLAGFDALGRQGLPAERVAQMATEEFLDFHLSQAPVDKFLADQLLLPAALASEASQYQVAEISSHLRTNAWAIAQFALARIAIDEDSQIVTVEPKKI
ncbi:MAG: RNA 3'-terminal phosphate cyclase [Prochloraceae cyanobacterium]